MKKLTLLILLALALHSCKTDSSTANTTAETADANEQKDEEFQTIEWSQFTASGTEPAWQIIIDAAEGELIYVLTMDGGEITKMGNAAIVMISSGISSIELEGTDEIIQFQILERTCADDAGNSFSKSIFFTAGGQKYIGCGEFASDVN